MGCQFRSVLKILAKRGRDDEEKDRSESLMYQYDSISHNLLAQVRIVLICLLLHSFIKECDGKLRSKNFCEKK